MTEIIASQSSNTLQQYSRSIGDKTYADSRESLFGHLVLERGQSVKTALENLRPQVRQTLKATEGATSWCHKIGFGSVGLGILVGSNPMSLGLAILPVLAGCLSLKLWTDSRDELPRRKAEYHLLKACSNLPEALYALHLRGVNTVVLVGAYDALVSAVKSRIDRGADFSEAEVGQFLESKISGLVGLENQTQSQQGLQTSEAQGNARTQDEPLAVTELQSIAAAPSFVSPNLTPPKTRSELIARLKQDCPLLLRLVKSHPIRAVGVQRSGKTTLVKRLSLLRMALMEGHSVVASSPHYEAANQYPDVFDVVGLRNGKRDYPAIERAWYQMAGDVESCNMVNVTYIWDEFGLQDKAIPITPESDPIKTVLTSCLRETMKFQIYPIFVLHGETAAFLPGSKGLVTVIMASTVRVETIGESVEGEDGLEMIQPTGRFNVTWLDGSKGEGVLPAWLTEDFLFGMIAPRSKPVVKTSSPSTATPVTTIDPIAHLENAYQAPAVEVQIQAVVSTRPDGLDEYPLIGAVWEYLLGKEPRSLKTTADAIRKSGRISMDLLEVKIPHVESFTDGIRQVLDYGIYKGFIVKVSEDAYQAAEKH